MTSTNPNLIFVAVPNRGAGQHQGEYRALDSGRNRIERQDDLCNHDAFGFPVRGFVFGCEGKTNATPDFFDEGEFRSEDVQHMAGLDYRQFHGTLAHRPPSDTGTTLTEGYSASRRTAEMDATKRTTWLTGTCSYEEFLETGMELRNCNLGDKQEQSLRRVVVWAAPSNKGADREYAADRASEKPNPEYSARAHCRVANVTSNANKISKRETISPHTSPIALAGASVPPNGSATKFQSGFSGFNQNDRDLPPDNSEQMYCSKYIAPFSFPSRIEWFPTARSSVSDNSEPKAVRFADVQKSFAGKFHA